MTAISGQRKSLVARPRWYLDVEGQAVDCAGPVVEDSREVSANRILLGYVELVVVFRGAWSDLARLLAYRVSNEEHILSPLQIVGFQCRVPHTVSARLRSGAAEQFFDNKSCERSRRLLFGAPFDSRCSFSYLLDFELADTSLDSLKPCGFLASKYAFSRKTISIAGADIEVVGHLVDKVIARLLLKVCACVSRASRTVNLALLGWRLVLDSLSLWALASSSLSSSLHCCCTSRDSASGPSLEG